MTFFLHNTTNARKALTQGWKKLGRRMHEIAPILKMYTDFITGGKVSQENLRTISGQSLTKLQQQRGPHPTQSAVEKRNMKRYEVCTMFFS